MGNKERLALMLITRAAPMALSAIGALVDKRKTKDIVPNGVAITNNAEANAINQYRNEMGGNIDADTLISMRNDLSHEEDAAELYERIRKAQLGRY